MSGWTVAWIVWGVMFVAIEGAAIVKKAPGATLSVHIWEIFSIRNKSTGWRVRRAALTITLAWLSSHLLFGV